MTEPAKPSGPPSNSGPPPTDEEAIRAAVAALAARLSPGGPPKEAPPEDGAVTPAPAVSEAAATVVPGRAGEPPKPVEAAATARMAAPRVEPPAALDRPGMQQAAPRRSIGRLLFILLMPPLLLGGAVWLLRDHPQVAALLGRGGSPAVEPKQAAAPTTPVAAPPTNPAKPDAPSPAPAATADPAPSLTAPSPAAEPAKPDSPTPATAAATPAEPPKAVPAPAATEPAKPDPALAPPTFDNVFVRDGRAVISGRAPVGSRVEVQVGGRTVATVEADARGEWVAILDAPLPPGGHEFRLVQTPPGGAPVPSDRTVAVLIPPPADPTPPVASAPPPPVQAAKPDVPPPAAAVPAPAPQLPPAAAAPSPPPSATPLVVATPTAPGGASQVLQGPPLARAGDLVLGTVDYDEAGRMTIAGRANPGETVRVYLNNQPVGDATAGADGRWTLSPGRATPHGPQRLRVDRLTAGGSGVAHRLEVPFERVTVKPGGAVTIVRGDNLWNIARGALGSGERYITIYEANRNQIRDPDLIYPGQVFVIPKPR